MGKTVVVTGASTGIGRATALGFHEAGFEVIATMRKPEAGADLPCRVEALDVTSDQSVDALFDSLGRVDVLVNNAGVAVPGSCEESEIDYLHQAMDVNFYGAVRCALKVIPQMRERRQGAILNTTSIAGRVTTPMQCGYSASKFALEAWAETLAYEMAPYDVRVAIIEPGFVLTPIFEKPYRQPSETYSQAGRRFLEFLLGQARHGTMPEDVAKVFIEAATTSKPRLRWLVGADARQMAERMTSAPEEEMFAMYADSDDASYWARFEKLFGSDLTPQKG